MTGNGHHGRSLYSLIRKVPPVALPPLKDGVELLNDQGRVDYHMYTAYGKQLRVGASTHRVRYPSMEEQMLSSNSFKLLRKESHKARVLLNQKTAMTKTIASIQIQYAERFTDSLKALNKEIQEKAVNLPLAKRIQQKVREQKNYGKSGGNMLDQLGVSILDLHENRKYHDQHKIKTMTRMILKNTTNLSKNLKEQRTLDLDQTANRISNNLFNSRIYYPEPTAEINYDNRRIDQHLLTMDKDFKNFLNKVQENKLNYTVPQGVIPEPQSFNEFYRVDYIDKIDMKLFDEAEDDKGDSSDYQYKENEEVEEENLEDDMESKSKEIQNFTVINVESISNMNGPESPLYRKSWTKKKKKTQIQKQDWRPKNSSRQSKYQGRQSTQYVKSSNSFVRGSTLNPHIKPFGHENETNSVKLREPVKSDGEVLSESISYDGYKAKPPSEVSLEIQEHQLHAPDANKFEKGSNELDSQKSTRWKTRSEQKNGQTEKKSSVQVKLEKAAKKLIAISQFQPKKKDKPDSFKCVPRMLKVNGYRPFSTIL